MKKSVLPIILFFEMFFLLPFALKGNIDSLKNIVNEKNSTKEKIDLLIDISVYYADRLEQDSSANYALRALEIGRELDRNGICKRRSSS